jgi:Restriction endonuclease
VPRVLEILVQVKSYRRNGRVSVNDIRYLAGVVLERGAHGLLVPTGQLTSVARQVLGRFNDVGAELQVLDGLALWGEVAGRGGLPQA